MIIGVGCDLTSINRTDELMKKYGERFLQKVFTEKEIQSGLNSPYPAQEFASWFSAKEAVQKALGAGIGAGIKFRDIEVISSPSRPPKIKLFGKAKQRALKLGVEKIHLSLSHEQDYALAMVVMEGGER